MKKLSLAICLLVAAVFSTSAQTLKWSTVADIFTTMIDAMAPELEQEFNGMGLQTSVGSSYDQDNKTIEMNIDFKNAALVEAMDSSMLGLMKTEMINNFISCSDTEQYEGLKAIIASMEKNNGKIKINLRAKDGKKIVQKNILITAGDMTSAFKSTYGE